MAKLLSKLLTNDLEEMRLLQEVLEGAPEYSFRTSGGPPSSAEAQSLFSALPPNKSYDDKSVMGFYFEDKMIGCADVIRGFPRQEIAMIGLLLLSEKYHAKGLGRLAYEEVERLCLSWHEIQTARIGVVETNASVLPFWKKMGFVETGERKSFIHGSIRCDNIVLEKSLRAAPQ